MTARAERAPVSKGDRVRIHYPGAVSDAIVENVKARGVYVTNVDIPVSERGPSTFGTLLYHDQFAADYDGPAPVEVLPR